VIYWAAQGASDELECEDFWRAFLDEAEQRQFAAMRFAVRRREWLMGRWVAKRTLQMYWRVHSGREVELRRLRIENLPHGAPAVAVETALALDVKDLSISISHRGGAAACAVCDDAGASIGIDLELIESRTPVFVADYFTPREQQQIALASDRDACVAALWSTKEAVLKAMGLGLSVDARRVDGRFSERDGDAWRTVSVMGDRLPWSERRARVSGASSVAESNQQVSVWWRPWANQVIALAMAGSNKVYQTDDLMELCLTSTGGKG
jgi:4'-phosphopantetheinyl transferase